MLNELYALSQSLSRCDLKVPQRHKDLKKNPKGNGFIVAINHDGSVASIEFCDADRMKETWKIDSGSNGISFPGFNISFPLWSVSSSAAEPIERLLKLKPDQISDRLSLIEKILGEASLGYEALGERQKQLLRANLREFPEQMAETFKAVPLEFKIIADLLTSLRNSTLSERDFLKSLSDAALKAYGDGKLSTDASLLLQNLLFGKWDKTKSHFTESKVAIILEPVGGIRYPYAITHHRTEEFINAQMNSEMSGKSFAKGGKGAVIKSGLDSLRGDHGEIQTRFPDPNLPILGITKLMSMTKDSLCQTRYGLQESDTFPVGKETTQAMLDALLFLTQEERRGKTWQGAPNSEEGGKDLLLVYLEDKPDSAISLADYFALETDDGLAAEAQFEAKAAKVCAALNSEPAINPDSLLRVLALTSRDKGRKQISFSEGYQVKEILQSAENWKQAAANSPSVVVPQQPKKNEKLSIMSPHCPHPASLLKCFNTQWTNEGTKSSWVGSCDLGQIYEIFLKQTVRSIITAERLLSLALQRNNGLLLALGNRLHGYNWKEFSDKSRLAALTSISTLAILLFKTNHRKENYMKQAPYNIGRLLSLADQLHTLYCKEVRGGDVPPQLFGNALMSTALQQPVTALSLFAQRVLPYQAWANTVNSGENVGLAKYFLKEIGGISQTINESTLPAKLNDAERAEMILGYLANNKENLPLNS